MFRDNVHLFLRLFLCGQPRTNVTCYFAFCLQPYKISPLFFNLKVEWYPNFHKIW